MGKDSFHVATVNPCTVHSASAQGQCTGCPSQDAHCKVTVQYAFMQFAHKMLHNNGWKGRIKAES